MPFGGQIDLFSGIEYQIYCISDIDITILSSSKIMVMKEQQNHFMAGDYHNVKNCIKGSQH